MKHRGNQQPLRVEADQSSQGHRPLLDDHLGSRRPVLGVGDGKQARPRGLDHGPRHVEAGGQSGKPVRPRQGLDGERRDAQIARLRLQHLERLVTQLPPNRHRLGPATLGCVAVVSTTLQTTGLLAEIAERGPNAPARFVGLQVNAAGIVAGQRRTKFIRIKLN